MKYLIVIDMQKDFVTGVLGTPEARAILPGVIARIEAAKANGETVLYTLDTHESNYMDTREGRFLPVPHCIRNTEGWLPEDGVLEALEDTLGFEKPTFGSPELADWLAGNAATEDGSDVTVELIGVCTDICVVSNAMLIKAYLPEAEVIVDASLCAGVTPESHAAALTTMKMCQIVVKNA